LTAEGKVPATINYYQGNLKRLLWYAHAHGWPEDSSKLDTWKLREFLAYAGTATNRWGTTGNGSENCRKPSKTGGWRYYRTLRACLRWAVSEGLLPGNPISKIKFIGPKQQPVEPYSQDEMKKMIAVCDGDFTIGSKFLGSRNKSIILLFVDSGMRLSELANLKLRDIALDAGRAVVLGKGGWQRVVAFNSGTKKSLWKYLAFRKHLVHDTDADWLWVTEAGRKLTVNGLHIAFRRIKKRAGVNSPGAVHRLRHTFALNALRGLKDPTLLQLLLGHKSLEMTRRYTQGLKVEEALEAIGKASPVDTLGLA
jgi:site-specific recombinase XerD